MWTYHPEDPKEHILVHFARKSFFEYQSSDVFENNFKQGSLLNIDVATNICFMKKSYKIVFIDY